MSVYATLISDRSLCSRSISLCYRSIDLDSRGITSDRMQIQVGCVHIENIHSNRFDKVEFQYFPGFGNQSQLLHTYVQLLRVHTVPKVHYYPKKSFRYLVRLRVKNWFQGGLILKKFKHSKQFCQNLLFWQNLEF